MIRLIIMLALTLFNAPVKAWEPCKPFCDTGCSIPAARAMASAFVANVNAVNATCIELTEALTQSNTNQIAQAQELGRAFIFETSELLSGLDAGTNILLLTQLQTNNAIAGFSDTFTFNFNNAIEYATLSLTTLENADMFGDFSSYRSPLLETCETCEMEIVSAVKTQLAEGPVDDIRAVTIKLEALNRLADNSLKKQTLKTWNNLLENGAKDQDEAALLEGLQQSPLRHSHTATKLRKVIREYALRHSRHLYIDSPLAGNFNYQQHPSIFNAIFGDIASIPSSEDRALHINTRSENGLLTERILQTQQQNALLYHWLLTLRANNTQHALSSLPQI